MSWEGRARIPLMRKLHSSHSTSFPLYPSAALVEAGPVTFGAVFWGINCVTLGMQPAENEGWRCNLKAGKNNIPLASPYSWEQFLALR